MVCSEKLEFNYGSGRSSSGALILFFEIIPFRSYQEKERISSSNADAAFIRPNSKKLLECKDSITRRHFVYKER